MNPKVLKTEAEYKAALARVATLMSAEPDTPEGEELELWSMLVENYEDREYPIPLPDPISAIKFRMEQAGLEHSDLIPYLGSKSKVSEVLSGRRPLSLTMIRKLHEGLGIPAEVLLRDPGANLSVKFQGVNWRQYPLAEIVKRQWIPGFRGTWQELLENAEELLGPFLFPEGLDVVQPACPRQSLRSGSEVNEHALRAWMARVLQQASTQEITPYLSGTVTEQFITEIGHLSRFATGPLLAQEELLKHGIHFVIERHLPGTHLDGMAIWCPGTAPVVAMTLRYDRLDNFWFTLCHELAHIDRHLGSGEMVAFVDDLEATSKDEREHEADTLASNCLIPADTWNIIKKNRWTDLTVLTMASHLRVDPSVVAGRIRREKKNYTVFTKMLGSQKVRKMFGLGS